MNFYANLAAMTLNEAINNKRYALNVCRTAAYSKYKAATVKRLSDELRALEMQITR